MSGRASCFSPQIYFYFRGYVPPSILVLLYLQNHGAVNVFLKDGVT